MFRRRRKDPDEVLEDDPAPDLDPEDLDPDDLDPDDLDPNRLDPNRLDPDDLAQDDEATEASDERPADAAPPRPGGAKGPYDAADAPQDELHRMDFGSLRVPVLDGMEVRFDLDETGQIAGFVLADGESMLQLAAFAAPKRSGLWDEVRAEIVASVQESGGHAEQTQGPFGTEVQARLPAELPGQFAPARFVGVDQPRWFLRGLVSGPAAIDPSSAERLLAVFGETVVDRGTEAMPLRDMLAITMPAEVAAAAQEAAQAAAQQQAAQQPVLSELLGPGPTITETR